MAPPGALARTMLSLRSQRRTGILTVEAEGTKTFVSLREGIPVFAEEGTSGETLGRLLVRLKLISHEQYLEVLSKMTEALVFNEQIRFGETAVELGYLTEEQVVSSLRDQVKWKIVRCFQREEVSWTFQDGAALVEDAGNFPMTVEALVLEAMLWLDSDRHMELGLGALRDKFPFATAAERAAITRRLSLDDKVAAKLVFLDGQKKVSDLIASPPTTAIDVEALLTMLAICGGAAFTDGPAPAAAQAPEVPPPPASDPRRVEQAQKAPQIDRMRTSQVLQRLDALIRNFKANDADIFKDPTSPREQRLLAETAFQRGRDHWQASRMAPASRAFRRAVQLAPENQEYALLALWCDLHDKTATDERAAMLVKRTAVGAVRRDPNLALGYLVLGVLAFQSGDTDTARKFLRRTRLLDPASKEAERYLRLLDARKDAGPQ